jgi:AraC-like DNA-binding protein
MRVRMNFYVDLIGKTIDYIEENIGERLSLEDISRQFCISEFHFNRMFKTVIGKTLKQYILGRKLTRACERLAVTDEPVIDIAYDFGFEYPEAFSRAFKKQFGVSPNGCRNENPDINLVSKAVVVERDIINYQGSLTLKGTFEYLKELHTLYPQIEIVWRPCEAHPRPERYGPHSDLIIQGMFFALAQGADIWSYHDIMYKAAIKDDADIEDINALVDIANGLLDADSFRKALQNGVYARVQQEGNAYAYEQSGVWAVPSYRMNGKKLDSRLGIGVSKKKLAAFLDKAILKE